MLARRINVPNVTGLGFAAAAVTLLLWIAYSSRPSLFVLPYVAGLCVTAICGAYILLATIYDSYRNPRRGVRIKPIRGFDLAVGLLLAAPCLWALYPFLPAL